MFFLPTQPPRPSLFSLFLVCLRPHQSPSILRHIHHSTPWSPAPAPRPPILQLLWRHVMIAFFVKVRDPWFSNIELTVGAILSNVHLCNWRMTLPLALQGDSDKAGECSWNWLLLYHQEA